MGPSMIWLQSFPRWYIYNAVNASKRVRTQSKTTKPSGRVASQEKGCTGMKQTSLFCRRRPDPCGNCEHIAKQVGPACRFWNGYSRIAIQERDNFKRKLLASTA